MSTISLSRVIGAGGENCQWILNMPGWNAHHPICATRKVPEHPSVQVFNAPAAYAPEPGSVCTPRKKQGAGPLHHSFCRVESKLEVSGLAAWVRMQELGRAVTSAT